MMTQKEIQKKNLDAELHVLRAEINDKSSELSLLLKDSDAIKHERAQFENQKKEFASFVELENKRLSDGFKELADARMGFEDEKAIKTTALFHIKEDIKKAVKELARINNQILTGEDEVKRLVDTKLALDAKIDLLDMMVSQTEKVKRELTIALANKEIVDVHVATQLAESHEIIDRTTKELFALKQELAQVTEKRDIVTAELDSFTRSLNIKKHDWTLVANRLNNRWEEVYPELRFPLTL